MWISFPFVATTYHWGKWFHNLQFSIMSKKFHLKLKFSSLIMEDFPTCKHMQIWFLHLWPYPIISWSSHVNLNFSGLLVLKKKILKDFPHVKLCQNGFLHCDPTLPLGAMILTNLIVDIVRKLECKSKPFFFLAKWVLKRF
jgi:hypothetical protein